MQIPFEFNAYQLAKAEQAATLRGSNLNTLIQEWIDRMPPLGSADPAPLLQKTRPSTNFAAVQKVIAMSPDERRKHNAGVIERIEEELHEISTASPAEIAEADEELAAFKILMNAERTQRGAEPLFDLP